MVNVATEELVPYLKTAIDLETSVFTQQEALEEAKSELDRNMPRELYYDEPREPRMPSPPGPKEVNNETTFWTVSIFITLIFIGIGLFFCLKGETGFGLPFILFGGVFIIASIRNISTSQQKVKDNERENQEAIKAYEDQCKAIKDDFERQKKEYQRNLENSKKEYEHSMMVHKNAEKVVSQLEESLKETQQTLDRLYSVGWIFPKYQNYVAVCSFYEYFLTGRCAILTGPDGAYNLYESELRQNMIVNRLDTIIDSLDDIKENQYTLYTEMKRANKTIEGIGEDVKEILSETKSISDATHIAAANSEITAKNTEAIKYISLINGVNGAKEVQQ